MQQFGTCGHENDHVCIVSLNFLTTKLFTLFTVHLPLCVGACLSIGRCLRAHIITWYLLLFRWTQGLLKLLQQQLSPNDLQLAAAAVHAVSPMSLFVQHVQANPGLYHMLTQAAASALQAGNR